jgi:type III restriction enzyme
VKIELKEFQQDRVNELANELRSASDEYIARGKRQAVCLSSPTGSGKTVMLTAAVERIVQGDESCGPNPDAMFLWLSDQPELNEQTRRKLLATSSSLGPEHLEVIGPAFNRELLPGGKVYFLNIQKLSKTSTLVKPGDGRAFTLWETIANTIDAAGANLYLIIDEAHRGMTEIRGARDEANAIVQRFIKGSDEVPAIPVVVGVSATPERFEELIKGTPRTRRSVEISPEEVRASGLLKEAITLFHPAKKAPSDITLLRQAARAWTRYVEHWDAYCTADGPDVVAPVLVVQVQDGSGKKVSQTDIEEAIEAINEEVGGLPDTALAHAFQEGGDLTVGQHRLRYVGPADIDRDPDVRVVFFKTSLNTGWDCPRAEVMMSFRTAVDATTIAQLIGRMVRAPLARRVGTDDFLNTVALYLPHYDKGGVDAVIKRLREADEGKAPIQIEKGDEVVDLHQDPALGECFALYRTLPSYVIPPARKLSEVKRLLKLARLLANDDIDVGAFDAARDALLDVLARHYTSLSADADFAATVAGEGRVRIRAVEWRFGATRKPGEDFLDVDVSQENLEDLFELAGRKLGEGLHSRYWQARCAADRTRKARAKCEIVALAARPEVIQALESTARELTQAWLKKHHSVISALPDGDKQRYQVIYKLASQPELMPGLEPPLNDRARRSEHKWKRHLYVDDGGDYPADFNRWESATLDEEIDGRGGLVGWLRNPARKDWAVCIPYTHAGEVRGAYPDFVMFRRVEGQLMAHIVDPHSLHLPDAPAKAAAMAEFAALHGLEFGGIDLIIVSKEGRTKRLDLTREEIRDEVKKVQTREHLQALFELPLGR